jgi:NADH-quinone oxidoreductase subunit L
VHLHLAAAGILLAATAKSAQLPFAPWLFAAMAGPTPASALLHSATLVSAGAYLLVRVAPAFDAVAWFLPTVTGIGIATALAGGFVALTQGHVKRVLAGSTSAQYGLMFVAVGAGSTAAAGAHLVAHALFKSLLFLAAGVAIHTAHREDLTGLRLWRRRRHTAVAAAVGALALAAVPPLGGGWTKEQVLAAAFDRSTALGAATLVAAFLTAAYAGRWWLLSFGPGGSTADDDSGPIGRTTLGALAALAGATVLLGVLWLPGASAVVERVTGGDSAHGGLAVAAAGVAAIVAAGLVVLSLQRRGQLATLRVPAAPRAVVADWFRLDRAASVLFVRPTLRLSQFVAAADQRVIDAGVELTSRVAGAASRLLSTRGELTLASVPRGMAAAALAAAGFMRTRVERAVEVVVGGLAAGTDATAATSRTVDDHAVDRAVERLASGTGWLGRRTQDTQTGLSHDYYRYAVIGAAVVITTLAVLR